MVIWLKTNDKFSMVSIIKYKILSSGFINSVISENGYTTKETSGTKNMFMKGDNKFTSKKLFIVIGRLDKKAINETIKVLLK